MAARKRSSATRRSKKDNSLLVTVGLVVGLVLAGIAYWWGTRVGERHIAQKAPVATVTVPTPPATAATAAARKPITAAKPTKPPKPRFDFYTLLPGETVLPDKDVKKSGAPKPVTKPEPGATYVLQAASYGSFDEADRLKAKLVLSGLEARIEKVSLEGKGDFFRVRLGPYAKLDDLDTADKRLVELGIHALRLKVKNSAAM